MTNKIIHISVFLSFTCLLICCGQPTKSKQNETSSETRSSDQYLKTIEELNKDFFKNYWEMETVILNQLKKEGPEYFIEHNCYEILGRFESTLATYCKICEKLDTDNPANLLTSYLHLNDTSNVKKQYERLQSSPNAFIYQDFYKYHDSGKKLEGNHLSIKYDERVEPFANALYKHVDTIEKFMAQEWDGFLPPKVRVMLLYSDGPGPYNVNLNETYLPVKSQSPSGSIGVAGHIVHETFHLVSSNLIQQYSNFEIGMDVNSFKFLDEGYAQLIESKFMNTFSENRTKVDQYSLEVTSSKNFELKHLKTKWSELFSSQEVNIYNLAYSFSYFLEEKYGEAKLKRLFIPQSKILANSWTEYVENYFNTSIDDLIEEWRLQLQSSGLKLDD